MQSVHVHDAGKGEPKRESPAAGAANTNGPALSKKVFLIHSSFFILRFGVCAAQHHTAVEGGF